MIQDGFFDRNKDIEKVINSLQHTIDCPLLPTSMMRVDEKNTLLEMKKYAKEQLLEK